MSTDHVRDRSNVHSGERGPHMPADAGIGTDPAMPADAAADAVDAGIKTYRIALLPGDGIGPEVLEAGTRVLRAVESRLHGVRFRCEEFAVGATEYLNHGDPLPAAVFERLRDFDAILLGAMGLPGVRWPTGVEIAPQLDLRERLDLYCGLRPIFLFHPDDSPLRGKDSPQPIRQSKSTLTNWPTGTAAPRMEAGSIDLLLVRESTEGLFYSRKNPADPQAPFAEDIMRITRRGSERVIRAAFRAALGRRRHVTLVDKANVLPSMAYFRRVFDEVALEFPAVQTERIYVDAAALYLVQRPESFDVLVTENMFGDILSDLAAGLVGGMGMAPSADIGNAYAVFQPSHGSAPDIAGRGIANPVATILSVAMMAEWFADVETRRAAAIIRGAVRAVFADRKARTQDMGGALSTREMAEAIVSALPDDSAGAPPGVGR